ncbi:MAG: [Fe-Fe] hydrogenase large subunit C-terminal domain-containing protein [Firmicutes bacterium]|nr:[Fe-Fe] hydrogenase large subunit C-terminal domain-containing protein [Bacillota bacterium]
MSQYYHSVTLDKDKCTGCTSCLKRCPTEAIRVRDGKARIIKERCIDCGECIRVCPHHAKIAMTDSLSDIKRYKYSVALPAPTLYGQFKGLKSITQVFSALRSLGFDGVYETSVGADVLSQHIRRMLQQGGVRKPLISSACPAIMRLIQVRFPALRENIVPLRPPVEAAALLARRSFCEKWGCNLKDIGIFFISPCPAKMTAKISPLGNHTSGIDGVLSMMELYGPLAAAINREAKSGAGFNQARIGLSGGVGWASSGGEANQVGTENYLAVDGVHNVIKALEAIEDGRLSEIDFFEGLACTGGCVGGPLVFEYSYIAKMRLHKLCEEMSREDRQTYRSGVHLDDTDALRFDYILPPNPVLKLDTDFRKALSMMERIDEIEADLPGLDCGSCGSPTCRCQAEDIVRGYSSEIDCIYKLKEQYRSLSDAEHKNNTFKGE